MRSQVFETCASANSATSARTRVIVPDREGFLNNPIVLYKQAFECYHFCMEKRLFQGKLFEWKSSGNGVVEDGNGAGHGVKPVEPLDKADRRDRAIHAVNNYAQHLGGSGETYGNGFSRENVGRMPSADVLEGVGLDFLARAVRAVAQMGRRNGSG